MKKIRGERRLRAYQNALEKSPLVSISLKLIRDFLITSLSHFNDNSSKLSKPLSKLESQEDNVYDKCVY